MKYLCQGDEDGVIGNRIEGGRFDDIYVENIVSKKDSEMLIDIFRTCWEEIYVNSDFPVSYESQDKQSVLNSIEAYLSDPHSYESDLDDNQFGPHPGIKLIQSANILDSFGIEHFDFDKEELLEDLLYLKVSGLDGRYRLTDEGGEKFLYVDPDEENCFLAFKERHEWLEEKIGEDYDGLMTELVQVLTTIENNQAIVNAQHIGAITDLSLRFASNGDETIPVAYGHYNDTSEFSSMIPAGNEAEAKESVERLGREGDLIPDEDFLIFGDDVYFDGNTVLMTDFGSPIQKRFKIDESETAHDSFMEFAHNHGIISEAQEIARMLSG